MAAPQGLGCSRGSLPSQEVSMPRGDKSAYTGKQKRMAKHIEKSYREEGFSKDRAAEIAWATVNKIDGGGKLSGSGRKKAKSAKKPGKNPASASSR